MSEEIDKKPVVVKIDDGELISSIGALNKKYVNIDLFNGDRASFNNYKLLWNSAQSKFTIGDFVCYDKNFNLGNCLQAGTLYLNGDDAIQKNGKDMVVGTHIEEKPADDLLSKRHKIKCSKYTVDAKFDFIYVQMTTGVPDDFGDEKYRKASENKQATANELKKSCDINKVRLGFSHYLTGYPLENGMTAEQIGKAQAQKFLKSIVGSETRIEDSTALNGGMIPMVVFMDNVTQLGYYGAAPIGVKKDLENF